MSEALAFFITFHTYGTWLHGRKQGSVDDAHQAYGRPWAAADAQREQASANRMGEDAALFSLAQSRVVLDAIVETCVYRDWNLHAVHVRSTHVHVVVTATGCAIEKVMVDLKAYATRALRRAEHFSKTQRIWSRHGSTRYLWDEQAVAEKVRYTLEEQGEPMARWPAGS